LSFSRFDQIHSSEETEEKTEHEQKRLKVTPETKNLAVSPAAALIDPASITPMNAAVSPMLFTAPDVSTPTKALFAGYETSNDKTKTTSTTNTKMLDALRTEASRGSYQIKIFYIRAPSPPPGYFGAWKGQCMVFFEMFHSIKFETHWAFRPDLFGKLMELGRKHSGSDIPSILLSIMAFPKRSKEDSYKQHVKGSTDKKGKKWEVHEAILGFVLTNDKTEEDIKTAVHQRIDAMVQPNMRQMYYAQREGNASPNVMAEIEPTSGKFWTTFRCAKADTVLYQLDHLDMVITTSIAINIVRTMFGYTSEDPLEWTNQDIAAYASSLYSQNSVAP
jgi:hypothetical protein